MYVNRNIYIRKGNKILKYAIEYVSILFLA